MPFKKGYKQSEPKPILAERRGKVNGELSAEQVCALGSLVLAAVKGGNAIYVQPSRFGTVTVKFYIEGEQFAENLNPGDDWADLAEQMIEALYDLDTVALCRRLFSVGALSGPQRAAAKAPNGKTPPEGSAAL